MRSSARVLLLVENNAYPFDVRVRREAHALRDAGYRVSVIAPRASGQPWDEFIRQPLVITDDRVRPGCIDDIQLFQ